MAKKASPTGETPQYTTYQTQDGSWMWLVTPKWATLPTEFPAKGKKPTEKEAKNMAIAYLREAELHRIYPNHRVNLDGGYQPPQNTRKPESAPPRPVVPPAPTPSPPSPAVDTASHVDDDITVLDASYLIHRSYHGINTSLQTPDGTPSNALFGVCKAVLRFIREKTPQLLLAAMDPGGETWRHKIFPEYKANREEKPDLDVQKPLIEEFFGICGIKVAKVKGYEADDIIGTLAAKFSPDRKVRVATRDKDLMQLVTEKVTLFDPYEDKEVGIEEVKARFGVPPEQVADVLALAGDTTDNIPGVEGIGEKTAAKLIAEYGSVEKLLENATAVKGKVGENLVKQQDTARLCKRLTVVDYAVPLDITAEQCTFSPDPVALTEFFKKHGLNSLLSDIPGGVPAAAAPTKLADDTITEFRGDYYFLSNYSRCPQPIVYNHKEYPTGEHLFHSFKTTDPEWKEKISTAPTPGDAKKLGRQAPLRPDWETRKIEAMRLVLKLKFSQPELQAKLLATGDRPLIEGNTWNDRFWGVCNGVGENHLGLLLMELREELRKASPPAPAQPKKGTQPETNPSAVNTVDPNEDGVSHINVYSKGKSKLGRLLSNFADTPFNLNGVRYACVEAFWYVTKMRNANKGTLTPVFSEEEIVAMAGRKGYDAKTVFKAYKRGEKADEPTAEELKQAYQAKLAAHPEIGQLLKGNNLPLAHYYMYKDKMVAADNYLWTAELWNKII